MERVVLLITFPCVCACVFVARLTRLKYKQLQRQEQGNGKFSIFCVGACGCVCVEVDQTCVYLCLRKFCVARVNQSLQAGNLTLMNLLGTKFLGFTSSPMHHHSLFRKCNFLRLSDLGEN